MYKLTLSETNNNSWRLTLRFQKFIKSIDYVDLEIAIKELKRAIEIRNNYEVD